MKKTLLFSALLTLHLFSLAQKGNDSSFSIKEAGIFLDLPNSNWKMTGRQESNERIVYFFKRDPIKDSLGRQIIPNIGIILEDVSKKVDAVSYSVEKRLKTPFDVLETFIHGEGKINFANAIGYKGAYLDESSIWHTIYVVHAINGKKGIQIILDATTAAFEIVEKEFLFVLQSIRK